MTPSAVILAILVVGTALLSSVAALLLMGALRGAGSRRDGELFGPADESAVFLFDGPYLVDATDAARALLDTLPGERTASGPAWPRLAAHLTPRFPTLEAEMATLARRGRLELRDARPEGGLVLRAEWRNGLARVALVEPDAEGARVVLDRLSHRAMEDELATLRATSDHAPFPVWRTVTHRTAEHGDAAGDTPDAVVWANRAYLDLAERMEAGDGELGWPLPRLFDAVDASSGRQTLDGADGTRHVFEVTKAVLDDGALHFALPADATEAAERSLRNFVQTLTRTFAHLPTGLAIFDADRRLALFNPALPDLTGLPPEFLARRPTFGAVFDRLREARMIPEPRDYKAWRQSLSELEKAAASGQYQETWSLPGGQTYRVTGRPYTDGAVAFLFDDISGETSLARRFRTDLETGQAVLDSLDAAIAVFSAAGTLVMSNKAYARLWGVDPGATLGEVSLADATGHWMARGGAVRQWAALRSALGDGTRTTDLEVTLGDGTRLSAAVRPLAGDARLVRFMPVADSAVIGRRSVPEPVAGAISAPPETGRGVDAAAAAPCPPGGMSVKPARPGKDARTADAHVLAPSATGQDGSSAGAPVDTRVEAPLKLLPPLARGSTPGT